MKIVISSAGRFHAVHLAQQLKQLDLLKHFFSAGTSAQDFYLLPRASVSFNWLVNFLDRCYVKFSVDRVLSPSKWYVLRDGLFDNYVKHEIEKFLPFELFVGWANCSLETIKFLKTYQIKTVLESGSMHILMQEHILRSEYEKFGIKFAPIEAANKNKMLAEYELTDRICVPSAHVRESFIAHGIDSSKIIKVPYGIDFNRFGDVNKIFTTKFKLLFVGQLSLQKGILYLLQVWQKLKLPKNQAELVLVGNLGAECRDQVLKLARQDSSINLVGSVPHAVVKSYLAQASAFVLPSVQEGLAMVIGEAMAAGLPVIATTLTGAAEFITHGKEGYLVAPGDTEDLSFYIQSMFSNPARAAHMGTLAKQKAQTWSWTDYALALSQEYKNIICPSLKEDLRQEA